MNTRGVGNRQAVNVDLTFGDPQRPQGDSNSGEKFNKKLEAVAQREERRRKKPKPQTPDVDAEDETDVALPAPRKGPAGPVAQGGVANRQKALHASVQGKAPAPEAKRASTVPRMLAEAKTDPGFVVPANIPRAVLAFQDVETGLLPAPHGAPPAPTDVPSIPLLEDDAFVEVADADVVAVDTSHYFSPEEVTEREDVPPRRK